MITNHIRIPKNGGDSVIYIKNIYEDVFIIYQKNKMHLSHPKPP